MDKPTNISAELWDTIDSWARWTIWALQKEIVKRKIGNSGMLLRGFTYQVMPGIDGSPQKVTIGFYYHGKFVDMGVGKGIKMENVKGNAEIWRSKTVDERKGQKQRRPNKWYSPTMYYEYQRLAELLRDKYALALPARFESTLSERINITL